MITVLGRNIEIPDNEKFIGFEQDNKIETRQFEITDTRLFGFDFKLDLKNSEYADIVDLAKEIQADRIILTWTVTRENLIYGGRLYAQIRAFSGNDEVWHSAVDYFDVNDSINATDYYPDVLPSEFVQMEQRVTAIQTDVSAKSEQVNTDKLTVSGYVDVASAKADEAAKKVIVSTEKVNGELIITYADGAEINVGNVDGQDGYTPVKGIDYFDGTDGADGYTPIKGIDYFDGQDGAKGADGHTPIRGTDYWTAEDIATIDAHIDDKMPDSLADINADEGAKLEGIDDNAQVNVIEAVKVNGAELSVVDKAVDIDVPTKTSDLENDGADGIKKFVGLSGDAVQYKFAKFTADGDIYNSGLDTSIDFSVGNDSSIPTTRAVYLHVNRVLPTKTSDLENDGDGVNNFKTLPSQVTTGTNITISDNTEYRFTDVTTLAFTYPGGDFECYIRFTTAASGAITITFPASSYIGSAPTFGNGETWELSIKDGIIIAAKVGDGT